MIQACLTCQDHESRLHPTPKTTKGCALALPTSVLRTSWLVSATSGAVRLSPRLPGTHRSYPSRQHNVTSWGATSSAPKRGRGATSSAPRHLGTVITEHSSCCDDVTVPQRLRTPLGHELFLLSSCFLIRAQHTKSTQHLPTELILPVGKHTWVSISTSQLKIFSVNPGDAGKAGRPIRSKKNIAGNPRV